MYLFLTILGAIVGLVVVAIVVILVLASLRPAEFRITRRATMAAPPDAVFAQVNDFHAWEHWSPWAKLDPTMKETYEGAPAGVGAIYTWTGNSKVGAGRMTITDSRPGERVVINLEFLRPFKATNTAEFTFAPEAGGTVVTWSMLGTNKLMTKVFDLLCNMDKTVGKDFEKGLAAMKARAEAG
jgi:uncharacterized protein YndB with AHSA1/START domain